jgi:TolA-binding protein
MSGAPGVPAGRSLLAIALPLALAACTVLRSTEAPEPTLADLDTVVTPSAPKPLPQLSLEEVSERYQQALDNADAPTRAQVERRLADLQMLSGEQKQLAATEATRSFDQAIAAYTALLASQPDHPDNDRVLYQLAKAYDMDGRGDEALATLDQLVRRYPHSAVIAEAQFRRAELLFARSRYRDAEGAYAAVVAAGSDTSFAQNALYMLGWTQFKQSHYETALRSFSRTLDRLWPTDGELDALPRVERELVDDTLRVMSLGFSYLEGPRSIVALSRELGERPYTAALYDHLGELYLTQKRYRDAADTWQAFVDANPLSRQAPAMFVKLIGAYAAGNFPADVRAQKAAYAQRYGIHSNYWAAADESQREQLRVELKGYLTELAQYHHAQAQKQSQQLSTADSKRASGDSAAAAEPRPTPEAIRATYAQAADYYQQYIHTFPQAPDVGNMVFLLAESRYESGQYRAAITAYEAAAYEYRDPVRGADAGYSAILAYDKLAPQLDAAQRADLQELKIDSELRFAAAYPQDSRAVAVQAHAADTLFGMNRHDEAIAAADKVTTWPGADAALRRSAWLIVAHSQFELARYAEAERGYREVLALTPAADPARAELSERLAASVYRQAEAKLAAGDRVAAADEFLRVAEVAPNASIRVNAQYDAATQLMESGDYARVIDVLSDMRQRFPTHALSAGIAAKMAIAYRESGQPAAAAAELTRVANEDADPAARREALLTAAELYQQAGDTSNAAARYRDFVERYPQPLDPAQEARAQLAALSASLNQPGERDRWLNEIIAADARAGAQRSERSRYLAAQAQDQFADQAYQRYVATRLTLPLKESLPRKRAALEQALQAYGRSAGYGVQEFATKAAFYIGEIYAGFSRELMGSPRPPELDELAREQYDLLLEEQAYPFEEKAIEAHEGNAQRCRTGIYDEWVQQSFDALAKLLPARYGKREEKIDVFTSIY